MSDANFSLFQNVSSNCASEVATSGESIENQVELCKEYAHRVFGNEYEIEFIIYEDEGFTGKNTCRPAFIEMINACREKQINVIVCYRLDRISRSITDFSNLITELNELEISFLSVRESFDTSSPMGRAMLYIASIFAQLERETIAERVRDNMYSLARTGRWLGGPAPLGYQSKRLETMRLDGKKHSLCQLDIKQDEIEIVHTIMSQFLSTHKFLTVVKYLKSNNMRGRTKEFMTSNTIKDILINPVYCIADQDAYEYLEKNGTDIAMPKSEFDGTHGLLGYNKRDYSKKKKKRQEMNKWIISVGQHEGIISGKDWAKIQELMKQNKRCQKSAIGNSYGLLSGIFYCSKCGVKMYGKRGNTETYYYMCRNKKYYGSDACSCKNLNGNQLDQKICEYLHDYLNPTSEIFLHIEKWKKNDPTKRKKQLRNKVEEDIEQKQKEINKLLETIVNDDKVSDALIHHINKKVIELDHDLSELKKRRLELERDAKKENIQEHVKQIMKLLSDFKSNDSLTVIEKRNIIKEIISRVEWDGEHVNITLKDTTV